MGEAGGDLPGGVMTRSWLGSRTRRAQSTSSKMPGWMKHKLESRLLEEISITSDNADNTTLMAESEDDLKGLLMRMKEDSEKVDLKHSEN